MKYEFLKPTYVRWLHCVNDNVLEHFYKYVFSLVADSMSLNKKLYLIFLFLSL